MAKIEDEIFRALGYLFISCIVYFSWKTAYRETIKSGFRKVLLKGFLICAGVSLFSALTLGTHSEDCDDDPLYGRCDTIQDYEPTSEQRIANFAYMMTLLYLPVIVGALQLREQQ